MEENQQMSFLKHLEELRWRLVRSAIAIVAVAIVIWIYQSWIMDNLFMSMNSPDFWTFRKMCEWFGVCVNEIDLEMQSTEVSGQFSYALMMSFMGGIVCAFPYLFFEIWQFIKPGLRQNEKKAASGIIFYVSLLFFSGILFGYFVVAPLCVQFFGNYKMSDQIQNIFTINSYMSMVMSTVFYTGLLFLLPVASFLLTKIGIISSDFLKKYRKHAIVGVLILAAVITPPDLISQVIVAIPITLLYEIGIVVSRRAEKKIPH